MRLEFLKEYLTLCSTLNYTQAAAMLNMTQPGLSKHIMMLENEIGTPLLERSSGSIALTRAGAVFREKAQEVLRAYDNAVMLARQASGCEQRFVSSPIGRTPSVVVFWSNPSSLLLGDTLK